MRSLIIASLVFVLIIALCITGYCFADSFSKDMIEKMNIIKDELNKGEFITCGKYVSESIKVLQKNNLWLASIANHEELNNMKTGLLRMQQYLAEADTVESKAQLSELIGLFTHFNESEQLSIENIF